MNPLDLFAWMKERLNDLHKETAFLMAIPFILLILLMIPALLTATIQILPGPSIGWVSIIIGVILLALAVEWWQDGEVEERNDALARLGQDPRLLKIRLMWKHQFQFCGFYKAQGGNTRIELREGGTPRGLDPVACVLEGFDHFGVTTAIDLIRHYQHNPDFHQQRIVPCLAIFRRSPVALLAPKNQPFSLDRLNGSRIAFPGRSDSTYREFSSLATHHNLKYEPVLLEDVVKYLRDPLAILREGGASYRVGYAFNEGVLAQWDGAYGWEYLSKILSEVLYADVLFTRLDTLRRREHECLDLCKRVRAGYSECGDPTNEHEVLALLREHCPDQFGAFARAMEDGHSNPILPAMQSLAYCLDSPVEGQALVGFVDDWKRMEQLVVGPTGAYSAFLEREKIFNLR